jgi:hypothetical protein
MGNVQNSQRQKKEPRSNKLKKNMEKREKDGSESLKWELS